MKNIKLCLVVITLVVLSSSTAMAKEDCSRFGNIELVFQCKQTNSLEEIAKQLKRINTAEDLKKRIMYENYLRSR